MGISVRPKMERSLGYGASMVFREPSAMGIGKGGSIVRICFVNVSTEYKTVTFF